MPAPGASWSRTEWLRRLGYKTGDEPPIAHAIQPTLRSGDATELLPPLLAPQGWFRAYSPGVPGSYAAVQLIPARGGAFFRVDIYQPHWIMVTEHPSTSPPYTTTSATPIQESQPGVQTAVSQGNVGSIPADAPRFGVPVVSTTNLVEFIAPLIFVPPGKCAIVGNSNISVSFDGAGFVRDVPVGLAPD